MSQYKEAISIIQQAINDAKISLPANQDWVLAEPFYLKNIVFLSSIDKLLHNALLESELNKLPLESVNSYIRNSIADRRTTKFFIVLQANESSVKRKSDFLKALIISILKDHFSIQNNHYKSDLELALINPDLLEDKMHKALPDFIKGIFATFSVAFNSIRYYEVIQLIRKSVYHAMVTFLPSEAMKRVYELLAHHENIAIIEEKIIQLVVSCDLSQVNIAKLDYLMKHASLISNDNALLDKLNNVRLVLSDLCILLDNCFKRALENQYSYALLKASLVKELDYRGGISASTTSLSAVNKQENYGRVSSKI